VPAGDPAALRDALRRFFGDAALRDRLRAAAPGSVADYAPAQVFGRLEHLLATVAEPRTTLAA
jgi:hypothetical protein